VTTDLERSSSRRAARTRFGEALDAPEVDDVVKQALPGEMYRVFIHYKRDEWERFISTVSDWDVNEYLDIIP